LPMIQTDLTSFSDEKLASMSTQDSSCFGELIGRYEKKLGRYIQRLLRASSQDIEDILQEIFINAFKNVNAFNPTLKFSSWIYRIAHNEAINHYRKTRRETKNISIDDEENEHITHVLQDSFDIQRETDNKEAYQKALELIMSLPDKYREVIILYYFEDKSYEELGDILKKPGGTIATLLKRARDHLRQAAKRNNIYP
jgi:RNA polymerase sigma-70 factor (ECF subfamily)